MFTAWRIVKARHAARAFDGEGARLNGGRWNSPGVAMVYTAATRALAVLEVAVNLDQASLLGSFVLIPCRFPESVVRPLAADRLPPDWRGAPAPPALAAPGDAWVARGESAVLEVPSAVVPDEAVYLINPAHPEFGVIEIGHPRPFRFDPRLGG